MDILVLWPLIQRFSQWQKSYIIHLCVSKTLASRRLWWVLQCLAYKQVLKLIFFEWMNQRICIPSQSIVGTILRNSVLEWPLQALRMPQNSTDFSLDTHLSARTAVHNSSWAAWLANALLWCSNFCVKLFLVESSSLNCASKNWSLWSTL